MNEGKDNIIIQKSYAFALEIIKLYKILVEKKEFVLSKQIYEAAHQLVPIFMKLLGVNRRRTLFTSWELR